MEGRVRATPTAYSNIGKRLFLGKMEKSIATTTYPKMVPTEFFWVIT
jgi:hypothetical protein